jgi:hypothetical protein
MAGGDAWSDYTGCAVETRDDSCAHFVATNPGRFNDVYYLINSVRVYQNGASYQHNSLASSLPQTSLTSLKEEQLSATTAEQSSLPVEPTSIITSTKIVTLPATKTHGSSYFPYDPSVSAAAPTTFASFYGKRLSEMALVAAPTVVITTVFITSTKVMTLPATLTGGNNYGPYDPSAPTIVSTALLAFHKKRFSMMASEAAPSLDTPSTTSAKPIGTRTGGINYGPYDPSATSAKPIGTRTEGVTNYTTVQTYRTSFTSSASQSSA